MLRTQRTAVAVEFVAVFAEAAKKRQDEGRANSHASRRGELVVENLPQPNEGERRPPATDEAAELFGVSGRSVRKELCGKFATKFGGRANSHASRRGELVGENLPQPNEGERGPRATDEAAKKRHAEGVRRGAEVTNSRRSRSVENLPQSVEGERRPPATDEAAELFGVSGKSVSDAKYVKNHDPEAFE